MLIQTTRWENGVFLASMLVCHVPSLWTMNPTFIDSCIKFSLEKIVELMYWKFRPESPPSPVLNEEVPDALFF